MTKYSVSAHYLPNYGGGKLIIERNRLELAPGFFGLSSSPNDGLRHASNVIHWFRLRIAWPWMRNGLVICSKDAMAVAFIPPFRRSQILNELQSVGFTLRKHSLWSYSKKSLTEIVSRSP